MKGNKINAVLWIILTVFLTSLLIKGLRGENWANQKIWSWNKDSSNVSIENTDWETENDYVKWTFNAENVKNIETEIVNAKLTCKVSEETDNIEVLISNNVNVSKTYTVGVKGDTFFLKRNSKVHIGFINTFNSSAKEIILILPDTIFEKIKIANVSGKIEATNISGRRIYIDNVSGKILAENLQGKVEINTVSGKIECTMEELKNSLEAHSVSGKIELNVSKDADFICDYETVSGSIETNFRKNGKKSGEITNGSEQYNLKVETVSGSIEINAL